MTPITKEEREYAIKRSRNVASIAVNGLGEIKWEDGTKTPAGNMRAELDVLSTNAIMLSDYAEKYEAALTAAEKRIEALEAALRPFADYAQYLIDGFDGEFGERIVDGIRRAIRTTDLRRAHAALQTEESGE